MSTSVVLPIRLVIDSGARLGAADVFAEPMTLALNQALERAGRDVFASQALPVVAERPSFVWTGEGLGELTEAQRSDIEVAVAELIARASRRAGVLPVEMLPKPSAAQPIAERYDETRDDGADGYLVDSYEGPEQPRNREVLRKTGGAASRPVTRVLQPRRSRLARFASPWAAARGLHEHILAALHAAGENIPFNGLFGVAFNGPKGQDHVCIFNGRVSAEKIEAVAVDYQSLSVMGVELDREGQPIYASSDAMLDASRHYFPVKRVGNRVADFEAAVAEITRLWLVTRSRFKEEYLDLAARRWAKERHGPGTRFQDVREEAIRQAVADLVRNSGLVVTQASAIYEAPDGSLTLFNAHKVGGFRIMVAYSATAVGSAPAEVPKQAELEKPEAHPEGEVDAGAYGAVKLVVGRDTLVFSLAPFEGELAIGKLGRFGDYLGYTMRTIADLLGLPEAEYRYAANFAIQAMAVLKARSLYAKFLETGGPAKVAPRSDGEGDLGDADVTPAASPAVQQLLDLARCSGLIDDLIKSVIARYLEPVRLDGSGRNRAPLDPHGMLEFLKAAGEPHAQMNGRIFADACSVVMLQALHAARDTVAVILGDLKRQEVEFQAVYPAMTGVLRSAGRYEELLYRLNTAEAEKLNLYLGDGTPPWPHSYEEAKNALSALLTKKYSDWEVRKDHLGVSEGLNWRADAEARGKVVGRPVYLPDGKVVIDDGHRKWTREDLENAIKVRSGMAGAINPFARHMRNIRGAYAAFTTSEQAAREYFDRLLKAIAAANKSAREDVLNKDDYAVETTRSASPTELNAIHRLAYNAVLKGFSNGELFRNGIAQLFKRMENEDEALQYVELGLTIGLGLIWAPLGIVAGLAFTLNRLDTALSHVNLARGLLDPDEIIRLGDAEMEAFFSAIEIAMFIATDAKELYTAGKALAVARTEARALSATARQTRALTASGMRRILGSLARDLGESVAAKVMVQVTLGLLMPQIMERILKPLTEPLARTANVNTGFDEALGKLLGVRGQDAIGTIVAELQAEGAGAPIGGSLEKDAERGAASNSENAQPGLGVPITIKPDGGTH